jgi:hypothetical protein
MGAVPAVSSALPTRLRPTHRPTRVTRGSTGLAVTVPVDGLGLPIDQADSTRRPHTTQASSPGQQIPTFRQRCPITAGSRAVKGACILGDEIGLGDQRRVRGLAGDDPAAGQVLPLRLLVPQADIGRAVTCFGGTLPRRSEPAYTNLLHHMAWMTDSPPTIGFSLTEALDRFSCNATSGVTRKQPARLRSHIAIGSADPAGAESAQIA